MRTANASACSQAPAALASLKVRHRLNTVIRSYAQWGESPNDRAPSIFNQPRLHYMQVEQIVDAAMISSADFMQRQRRPGGVEYCIISSGNRVSVETMLKTEQGYSAAILGPPPFRNRLCFAHSALTPSFARL